MPKPTETEDNEPIEDTQIDDNDSDIDNSDIEIEDADDDDEDDVVDTDIDDNYNNEEIVDNKDRISRPFLTKYELVRIIGTRRKQLYLGAKPMIKINTDIPIEDIVTLELKQKMIPFKIKRPIPNSNKVEIWNLSELSFEHLLI